MNKLPRNNATIFRIFEHDIPDRTGKVLQNAGIYSFAASFVAGILIFLWPGYIGQSKQVAAQIILATYYSGWLLGLIFFLATGIHYVGRGAEKSNFIGALLHVLGKTFLYLFLPCMVITGLLLIWAYVTKQFIFR